MRQIQASLLLVSIFTLSAAFAGDKDGPRSLVAEAAFLAEKGGQKGWLAEDVAYTKDAGKQKAKGKLSLFFGAPKDKPTGNVQIMINIHPEFGSTTMIMRAGLATPRYELVEKDGKRYIKLMEPLRGLKAEPEPKVIAMLEYSIKAHELSVKPAAVFTGSGWDLDLDKAIVFKPAQEWSGFLKDDELRKKAPVQIDATIGYVADAKSWETLWTAWRPREELPKVDFARELVVVITVNGPNLPLMVPAPKTDAKGNLPLNFREPKATGEGFSYSLAVHSRSIVKSINRKPIDAK